MSKSTPNFENWTDGTRVYDKRDGQEGTIRGDFWKYAAKFEVEMDVEKRDSFGMRVGGFRSAHDNGHWAELATEEDSKDARKIRATFSAKAAIYAHAEAAGEALQEDFQNLKEADQQKKLANLLADLHHLADTFDLDFESALGNAQLYYFGEV